MSQKLADLKLPAEVSQILAVHEENMRQFEAIDRFYARRRPVGTGKTQQDKRTLAPATLHDLAASNPLLRALLRDLQK